MVAKDDDDEDLRDLLGNNKNKRRGQQQNQNQQQQQQQGLHAGSTMMPFDIDDELSETELEYVPRRNKNFKSNKLLDFIGIVCMYCSYTCDYAPKTCLFFGVIAVIVPTIIIVQATFLNPTQQFGIINTDFSMITPSKYDLSVGKIHHWCLKGDNDSCRCEDPLEPQSRGEFRTWTDAFSANTKAVARMVQDQFQPDVALLGGSIVEEMEGRWMGKVPSDDLSQLGKMFRQNFNKASGASIDGIALGIAGDTNPSVLFRLLHGEMPEQFNPKIWWLELGMNDLGRMQCSEEVVVLGILRVVEEIVNKKPDARIVINSLLPMASLRGGATPLETDYRQSLSSGKHAAASHYANGPAPNRQLLSSSQLRQGYHEDDYDYLTNNDNDINDSIALNWNHHDVDDHRQLWFNWFGGKNRNKPSGTKLSSTSPQTQKKFTTVTHREKKLPLWTSITAINDQLRKFCANQDYVSFFDATKIFAEPYRNDDDDDDDDSIAYWTLKDDMVTVRGLPTELGYDQWETAIVERVKKILKNIKNGVKDNFD